MLDLGGDSIELTGVNNSVLFDHNADGTKTGTQWVKPDDGMLVRDLNGNGNIDSGRELFGDQTLLSNGNLAANGFAALADLDTNADGVIDSADAAYADLKIWRDLNQDGVSQEGELQSLVDLGITAINLNANPQGVSNYTRTVTAADGSTSSVTRLVLNVNFASNPFYREFTDNPEVTETAAALPQMQGAGMVRDLREAMSLGTQQSSALEQSVATFKAASTAQERQALLDQVINTWAATSSQSDALTRNATVTNGWYKATVGDAIAAYAQAKPAEYAMMSALERFNGLAVLERYVRQRSASYYEPSEQRWKAYTYYVVEIEAPRLALFAQAYAPLKASVYQSLYMQTAGQDLLDQVELIIDDNGLRLDFTAVDAAFAAKTAQDPTQTAVDLAEFLHFTRSSLQGSDWDGAAQLAELLETNQLNTEQSAILAGFNYKFVGAIGDLTPGNLGGSYDADVLVGRAGNDTLSGGSGDDILIGGAGNDQLYGGYGNDQLVGGAGDDYLNGQWGTDTYFWGTGQGNDTIADGMVNAGEQNTVVLRGLNPGDVSVELVTPENYSRFKVTILATGETLTLDTNGWDYWSGSKQAPVRLAFADGSQWGFEEIIRQTLALPTDGDDFLMGTPVGDREDRLNGGAGNDIIVGRGGLDVMEGGAGNDKLYGNAVLSTWANNQTVPAYWDFNAVSNGDSDVYVFGRDDGQDEIFDYDRGVNEDVLRFKEGVSAQDLELAQRGNDLVAVIKGSTDRITIKNFYLNGTQWWQPRNGEVYAIERFDFADGTQWNLADIKRAGWAGTAQDDVFTGNDGANYIAGGAGNDLLDGGNGNDELHGGDGNDVLDGGFGDDVLDGGAGDDLLYAGYGADVIRFGRGDGKDVLARDVFWQNNYFARVNGQSLNPVGNNAVELKAGVNPGDVKLVREGSHLLIKIKGTDDVLTVKDFYVTGSVWDAPVDLNFSLREIRFEDGTVWEPADMLAQTLIGDESNETFIGFETDEVFDGGGGNDRFQGNGGNDTYLFGRGDGADRVSGWQSTLAFKPGVTPDDVIVRRVGNDAVFSIRGTTDSITFEYAFPTWMQGLDRMSAVTFADGTNWTAGLINQKVTQGTDGDDVITDLRLPGVTVLAGGVGNDLLIGERSDATVFVFNRGDGQDIIDQRGAFTLDDTLRFGPDIVASDLRVSVQGEDMVIGISGTSDQVTIRRHADWAIERFEVGGVTLSLEQVLSLDPAYGGENIYGSSGNDVLVGSGKVSALWGFEGDDILYGNDGDDVLVGDAGHDILYGGNGADVLDGGEGDDILAGGTGRDQLRGGAGANTYIYNRGDALDTIILAPGASDVIQMGEGFESWSVSVQFGNGLVWDGSQMLHQMVIGFESNDALLLQIPEDYAFDAALDTAAVLRFADGTSYSYADLMMRVDSGVLGYHRQWGDSVYMEGSYGDDTLYTEGGSGAYMYGRGNNDYLYAYGTQAQMHGGDGDDYLAAAGGGAVMAGARGADTVNTNTWGDVNTVVYSLGDGYDRIEGGGTLPGVLSLGVGITPDNLLMHIAGNGDLVLRIVGSDDDEIRMAWYDADLVTPYWEGRAIDKLQFIDANGSVRLFDLTRLDGHFDAGALSGNATGEGLAALVLAPQLEVLTPAPVYGGEAAIVYAQWGDFGEDAYIAGNEDPDGDNILFGTPDAETLDGGAGNDRVMAGAGDDTLIGGTGNDYLDGQGGNDLLISGDGDDILVGGAGNDVLDAGTGNNQAYGGDGDDTYLYARGNGYLYIDDGHTLDGGEGGGEAFRYSSANQSFDGGEGGYGGGGDYNQLVFGEGITLADLRFERDGDNLKVTVAGAEGDVIVMAGFNEYMDSRNRSIDAFVFQDGSSVALDSLWGPNSDTLLLARGDGNGDVMGTELRDHLIGDRGDNILEGGYGDDRLEGGAGNDVYVMGYDSGDDVIVDTAGDDNIIVLTDWSASAGNIQLQTENGEAVLWLPRGSIKLEGWDGQDASRSPISSLHFADGSVLSMADLLNQSRGIMGTPGDDVLQGGAGDDWIYGLSGNDLMMGGAGADTYVIEENSGADIITDTSTPGQENSIIFLDGIAPEDIQLTLDQDRKLVLKWWDGSQVTLTEFDYLDPLDTQSVMFFQFGWDGPVLSYEELLERGFEIDGTAQNDVLATTGLHDEVRAGDGDDVILGSAGDDVLFGGSGNDVYEYRLGDGWVEINDTVDETGANVVRFGEGITPDMLDRKLRFVLDADGAEYSRFIIMFDEDNGLEFSGFDPQAPETGAHAVEYFEFADGTVLSWGQLLDKVFVVEGDTDDNALSGTSRSDRLYGYEGEDVLVGNAGDDVLTGASGSDLLQGGAGADNYVFELGDGEDTIVDDGLDDNVITFGVGVSEADISVERDGADFVVYYGDLGDSIRIASADGVNTPTQVIGHFELADGTLVPFAQFINQAPMAGDLLQDQLARVGDEVVFEFSGGAFVDPDGSELSYRAQLSNGDALPDWLSFNPLTRTFSGVPPLEAVGSYEISVFAVDPSGAAMQQRFSFAVESLPNHVPQAMSDQAELQEDVSITATGNVLTNDLDEDANTVLTVANFGTMQGLWGVLELQADGSYVYSLDNANPLVQALGQGQSQTDVFTYSVTDGADSSSSQLIVTIAGSNDVPVLSADTALTQEDAVTEVSGSVLANDTDIDGDALSVVDAGTYAGLYGTLTLNADGSYRYVLNNSSALVQGLRAGQNVQEDFSYNVSDGMASVLGSLAISVMGTNDGPQVFADTASVLEDTQPTAQGNVLVNDVDGDAGDVLQLANAGVFYGQYGTLTLALDGGYSYTLYNDASIQSLAAGQGVTDVFNYVATDGLDNATTTLTVTVTGENDAPIIVSTVGPQTGREGQAFSFLVPEAMFMDVDQGDALTYSVSLAGGAALPAWLSFNATTRMLSGTPGDADAGVFSLQVSATDKAGASVSSAFELTIEDGVCTVGGVFNGTAQNDIINGTECADVINGLGGNDQLYGNGGNDVLNGGKGVDFVSGGAGNDTLQMSIDAIWGWGSFAKHLGSPGVSGSGARASLKGMNRSLDTFDGGSGWDTLAGTSGNDALILDTGSGSLPQLRDIEQFDLGAGNDVLDLTSSRFSYGNVVVNGGSGNENIWSSSGNDRIYGGAGCDTIDAGAGDDFVDGGDQDDRLISLLGYGNDIVRGGAGNDIVIDMSGQNLLDGGVGSDLLVDGNGNSVLVGGKGNDVLKLGRGRDTILFNRGDGKDTIIGGDGCVANDTLVLGGGIRYEDLSFKRDDDDLILVINQDGCAADQIRFSDWYEGNKTIGRLEIAVDASSAYQAGGANLLLNKRTQSFDFEGLVAKFNAESNDGCSSHDSEHSQAWSLSASLLQFHLGGSDTAVMGGDMAHYYAHQGTLNGLSLSVAQAALGSTQLGASQQAVSPLEVQASGAVRL